VKIAVGGVAALMLAGVATGIGASVNRAEAAGLSAFDDCQAVDDWYTAALLPQVTAWGLPMYGYGGVALAAEGSAAMPDLARADTAAPVGNGATGTNLQEHDVDEPDTAKTANGVLVTTIGGRLVVFDVTGEAPVELGSVQIEPLAQRLETFSPPDVPPGAEVAPSPSWGQAQLLMDGNRVVIIGSGFRSHDVATQRDMSLVAPMPTTTVTLVDIADPGAPTVLSTTEIEGSLLDARQHEGSVRIVTTSSFPPPPTTSSTTRETPTRPRRPRPSRRTRLRCKR
jgi:hypothetical protein